MGTFSDPVSLNVCELTEKETESDLQPGSGRRATVKGAGIVFVITASLSARVCLLLLSVPLLMLNPFPHHKCERKPGKSHPNESSESIMDTS